MHPIENILQTTMSEIKELVDVSTIIGQPVEAKNGTTVLPISKVSIGLVSGGGEYGQSTTIKGYPFSGGSGTGVSITPVGFLVIDDNGVRVISANNDNALGRIIEQTPKIVNDIKKVIKNDKNV